MYFQEDIKVLVHGDDFVASGERERILRFKEQLARRFTIKSKIVGSGARSVGNPASTESGVGISLQGGTQGKETREARILNRIVRWTPVDGNTKLTSDTQN